MFVKTDNKCEANNIQLIAEKSPKVVYERDSMERFGDDLTEQVMQYLWFSDKVMFECLSKQWQRLVFNKQTELDIKEDCIERKNSLIKLFRKKYMYWLDRRDLISVVKKCLNISRVYLREWKCDVELNVITAYCRRVTKLILYRAYGEQPLISFATKHGMWLEEFGINETHLVLPNYMKKFLQMCPNIKKIDINLEFNFDVIDESESLPKLEVIKEVRLYEEDSQRLDVLVRKYSTRLKAIQITFIQISSDELKTCFAHISRFESLESLEFKIKFTSNFIYEEHFRECFKLLANNCTKLRELNINTESCVLCNRIFLALSELRYLERLNVFQIYSLDKLERSVECLKHMTRLKHLSINHIGQTLDFLDNIQTYLPEIRYLDIDSINRDYKSWKVFAESLQTMKYIKRLVVNNNMKFYYNKNRSESKPRILLQLK